MKRREENERKRGNEYVTRKCSSVRGSIINKREEFEYREELMEQGSDAEF